MEHQTVAAKYFSLNQRDSTSGELVTS